MRYLDFFCIWQGYLIGCEIQKLNKSDKLIQRNFCASRKTVYFVLVFPTVGRNVALRQMVRQSHEDPIGQASLAVDGNRENLKNTELLCTNTSIEEHGPEWHITFSRPQILYTITFYSNEGSFFFHVVCFSFKDVIRVRQARKSVQGARLEERYFYD